MKLLFHLVYLLCFQCLPTVTLLVIVEHLPLVSIRGRTNKMLSKSKIVSSPPCLHALISTVCDSRELRQAFSER